jgi:hypothetical protein
MFASPPFEDPFREIRDRDSEFASSFSSFFFLIYLKRFASQVVPFLVVVVCCSLARSR